MTDVKGVAVAAGWRMPQLRECDFMGVPPTIAYVPSGSLSRDNMPRSWLPPANEVVPAAGKIDAPVLSSAAVPLGGAPVRLDMNDAREIRADVASCRRAPKARKKADHYHHHLCLGTEESSATNSRRPRPPSIRRRRAKKASTTAEATETEATTTTTTTSMADVPPSIRWTNLKLGEVGASDPLAMLTPGMASIVRNAPLSSAATPFGGTLDLLGLRSFDPQGCVAEMPVAISGSALPSPLLATHP